MHRCFRCLMIFMSLYAVSSCQCYYYKEGETAGYNKKKIKKTLNNVNVYLAQSIEHKVINLRRFLPIQAHFIS